METSDLIEMIVLEDNDANRSFILEELYWSDLNDLNQETMENIIIPYLLESQSKDEIAGAMKLYGNPDGAYLELFQDMIIQLYHKDPIAYIAAATDYPAEGLDTLYIFRNRSVFKDIDMEKVKLLDQVDNDDMKSKVEQFFRMYDNICHT